MSLEPQVPSGIAGGTSPMLCLRKNLVFLTRGISPAGIGETNAMRRPADVALTIPLRSSAQRELKEVKQENIWLLRPANPGERSPAE